MSVKKFHVGDKVRVRSNLVSDGTYDEVYVNKRMTRYCDRVLTITSVKKDCYEVKENDWDWNDEMLEPVEKTLSNLVSGDKVVQADAIRKILAAVDGCYLLSYAGDYTVAATWYTVDELEDIGYQVFTQNSADTTIEIDGHKYNKSEVEKAIKGLESIE